MGKTGVCLVCGKATVYAKGRCRNCYERFRKNGDDLSRADRARVRYMGQTQNGWQVVDVTSDEHATKLVVRCTTCGKTMMVFPGRFYHLGEHRACVKLLATTDKQEQFARAFSENHYSITETAQALNVSKASASDMFRRMRKNYRERSN